MTMYYQLILSLLVCFWTSYKVQSFQPQNVPNIFCGPDINLDFVNLILFSSIKCNGYCNITYIILR